MASSKRALDRESALVVRGSDNHIEDVGFEEKDGTSETRLDGTSDDQGVSDSAGKIELKSVRVPVQVQEVTAGEHAHASLGLVVECIEGHDDSGSQTSSVATPPFPSDLGNGTVLALGRPNETPSDHIIVGGDAPEMEGLATVKNPLEPLNPPAETGDEDSICGLSNGPEDAIEATPPRQSIENPSEVAVQNFGLRPDVHLVSDGLGSEEHDGRLSGARSVDESTATANFCETGKGNPISVAEEDVIHDGRGSQYRVDCPGGRHIEDEAFYQVRRSRMQEDLGAVFRIVRGLPGVVFRIVRGLAGVVTPGAIRFDGDIEMQASATFDVSDVGGQSQGDTQSDSYGNDGGSTSNAVDDSRSSSPSRSSDAASTSRGLSSNHRRYRHYRHHYRSTHMTRYEQGRLLCVAIGGIVAIINVVFLFMTTDMNGGAVAGGHRQIVKGFSQFATLFMF